jgi:hypothetical protein
MSFFAPDRLSWRASHVLRGPLGSRAVLGHAVNGLRATEENAWCAPRCGGGTEQLLLQLRERIVSVRELLMLEPEVV